MSDNTTIQVSKDFRNKLWNLKGPSNTYENVLKEHLPDEILDE